MNEDILSSDIIGAVNVSPLTEGPNYELVPGTRCNDEECQVAPLLFPLSDVMAAITANEVIVFHREKRQRDAPVGLKNTLRSLKTKHQRVSQISF